ncbi:hypothetical protein MRX96_012309 [Rhipicephalus microplus]
MMLIFRIAVRITGAPVKHLETSASAQWAGKYRSDAAASIAILLYRAGAAFYRRGPAVVCLIGWPTDYSHRRFWRVLGYTFEQLFRAPQPVFSGFGWFAAKSRLYGVRRPATWCNVG